MKIKINNRNLGSKDIEDLLNEILWYAVECAREYDPDEEYDRIRAQAYSEILQAVYDWSITEKAAFNRDLKKWTENYLLGRICKNDNRIARLRIKIKNENLGTENIERLINQFLCSAEKISQERHMGNIYSQAITWAYTELLETIYNWSVFREAKINRNLENWAAKHLI